MELPLAQIQLENPPHISKGNILDFFPLKMEKISPKKMDWLGEGSYTSKYPLLSKIGRWFMKSTSPASLMIILSDM